LAERNFYYLQKALKALFTEEAQLILRNQIIDPERETVPLVTPPEILKRIEQEMSRDGIKNCSPKWGVLIGPDTPQNIGIACIPKSTEDLKIVTTQFKVDNTASEQLKRSLELSQIMKANVEDLAKRRNDSQNDDLNFTSWKEFLVACGIPSDRAESYQVKMIKEEFDLKDWPNLAKGLELLDFIKKGDLLKIKLFYLKNRKKETLNFLDSL